MYELDLKNSFIDYATQREKKYFKYAINYALQHDLYYVIVNRIHYQFDFGNLKVKIGTKNNMYTYKMKLKGVE